MTVCLLPRYFPYLLGKEILNSIEAGNTFFQLIISYNKYFIILY